MERLKIPDAIAQTAINVYTNKLVDLSDRFTICKAVCAAISKNPIVPTEEQAKSFYDSIRFENRGELTIKLLSEWQRRMFLEPEEELPAEVRRLLWDMTSSTYENALSEKHNERVIAAYLIGLHNRKDQ